MLRFKRKQLFYTFLNTNKNYVKNSAKRNLIKRLVDKSFAIFVKPNLENL